MEKILLGGSRSVGKTTAIRSVYNLLRENDYELFEGFEEPDRFIDFCVVVFHLKSKLKVIINSGTDDYSLIERVGNVYHSHQDAHFFISSVRDADDIRRHFFEVMGITDSGSEVLEIPLGKVRTGDKRPVAIDWYHKNLLGLIEHLISREPYRLI